MSIPPLHCLVNHHAEELGNPFIVFSPSNLQTSACTLQIFEPPLLEISINCMRIFFSLLEQGRFPISITWYFIKHLSQGAVKAFRGNHRLFHGLLKQFNIYRRFEHIYDLGSVALNCLIINKKLSNSEFESHSLYEQGDGTA